MDTADRRMVIQVNGVSKAFKDNNVLVDVNMNVEKGSICGLIGRNGSGKTLLMKIICGFAKADRGEVYVNGGQIGRDIDFPKDTGIIIENPGFIPYMSGYDNLVSLSSISGKVNKEGILQCMEFVQLDPDDKKHVSKYSLGMRQRLGIAQAIMENPSILILDEPMNGLDNQGVDEMRKLFLKLKEDGKTILFASHNREDISVLCDRLYEIDMGKLQEKDQHITWQV